MEKKMNEMQFGSLGKNEEFKPMDKTNATTCKKLEFPVIDCITFLHVIERWKKGDKFDNEFLFDINNPFTAVDSRGGLLRIPNSALVAKVNK